MPTPEHCARTPTATAGNAGSTGRLDPGGEFLRGVNMKRERRCRMSAFRLQRINPDIAGNTGGSEPRSSTAVLHFRRGAKLWIIWRHAPVSAARALPV